ncbi:multi-sensor signal transduction multi-kinase [Rivularia sp. IAM M-261]|nr:multi-sensor signal transduction multi-kinase [Rivularia sp. IAM M-261]
MILSGYQIGEQIYAGTRTLVYRGVRQQDQKPVVIKLLRRDYPSVSELVQFRNQYTITKNLDNEGIVRTYSLENYQNSYALVMEDFGGISLKEYTSATPINLADFFPIALQIVTILNNLYHYKIIHKDIKPANILINPATKQVKLIDFSIASLLSRETQTPSCPNVLEGTLAYISPEQTGRMNRLVDWRSDFYSLGASFYELLTGQLPFTTNDLMELVYCHLAKQPPQATTINTEIPIVISNIVAKLMAKNAEDRYQSALGLKHDLEQAYLIYKETGEFKNFDPNFYTNFELGKRDIPDRFTIPEKLYGRESEIKTLLTAFDRIAKPFTEVNRSEMILVAGYSGVGKTAIINEIHRPIVQKKGYFIKGKYDQFQRNIPLSGFVQAFRDLMQQILSEKDAQLHSWKNKILAELGEQSQVIIEVIPELEEIVGKQPPVTELFGSAAANRFNLLFQKFLQVFTSKEHPLVIFIDDLQWADSASLKLIELVMQSNTQYLLLIGAYRDNEVAPAHPLMLTLDKIQKDKGVINTIELKPLSLTDLNCLIADALNCSSDAAISLTELIHQKTKGNPFFSNQLLKSLYEDGLIYFNHEKLYWECRLSQIKQLVLNDDVVDFMVLQLQKLPLTTQEILKSAACIGNQFDLKTLAIINDKSPGEIGAELWKALQEGFVIPTNEVYKFYQNDVNDIHDNTLGALNGHYKFLHDRVQQAAYLLIPEEQKKSTHLNIGQLLLNNTPREKHEERIFDIVNQLNYGVDLIKSQEQLNQLAHLNLIAGRKAKISTAYNAASQYLNSALEIISTDSWQSQYNLTLALYENACDAAYLCGDYEKMEQLAQKVIDNGASLLDKIGTYEIQIQGNIVQNKLTNALTIAIDILKLIGIKFPDTPSQLDIQQAFQRTAEKLADKEIPDLIYLPEMTDPNILAAMRILLSMFPAAYVGCPEFVPLVSLKMVDLSMQYGNTGISAFGYCTYGFLLCGVIGDIEAGYEFGQLCLNVLSKTDTTSLQAKILLPYNSFIGHWKNHAQQYLIPLQEVYKIGIENGDLEFACYGLQNYSFSSYLTGQELTNIEQEMALYCKTIQKFQQTSSLYSTQIWRQTVLNLMGRSEDRCCLVGEAYNENTMLPIHYEMNYLMAIEIVYFNKLVLNYLFNNLKIALLHSAEAEKFLPSVTSSIIVPIFYFYDSLVRLAAYKEVAPLEKNQFLEKVDSNQNKMKHWANYAPMNFLHKYYLVEAERYRVLNDKITAMEYYDKAISLAKENNYIQEEALANELAAKFYLDWDKQTIAQAYIVNSYYCYARWGALAKVSDLEARYPELLVSTRQQEIININFNPTETISVNSSDRTVTGSTKILGALDLSSFVKASQAISSEIELDKLLVKLMQILLENAGATKAVLILSKSDKLVIEATSVSTSTTTVLQSIPLDESQDIPISLINYVSRTRKSLILNDAVTEMGSFKYDLKQIDPYIFESKPKSLLCNPILNQGKLIGILYLENNLNIGTFTKDRLDSISLLCSQAAISLENASLYQQSQDYAQQLKQSFDSLKQAQLQLIQSEKMSALGNLVSGIGHEINNPVGFLAGNIQPTHEYVQDLLALIDLYQEHYPNPVAKIAKEIKTRDIEFIKQDLPKVISSMGQAVDRIYDISISLRTFSRADTDKKILFNIHEGIDSTLMILKHRLKASNTRPEIAVVTNYDDLPQIKCFPGQLNQVFMNLLANAIDALDESNVGRSYNEIILNPNLITITTKLSDTKEDVIISIQDNGLGMAPEVKAQIFDHLFTTKPVGQGTGLGLAIAYQIIVEKHCGKIEVTSAPGQGACFQIMIPV